MSSLSSERSATAGGIILVLRFAAASVLNYLFGVALAWVLVPDAFGTVSALQNVLLLAAGAMAAGLPWALAVKVARGGGDGDTEEREIRTALLGNFGIGMVLAIALVVAQLAGLQVIPTSSVVVTLTVACTLPAMGVATVLAGALQGSRRFGGLGATQSVEILIKCLVGLALVTLLGAGPEGVALGFLTGSLAAIAVAVRALRGILPRRGPLARLNTFRMALPIWVGAASATTLLTADLLGLGVVGAAHGVTASTLAAYQVCAILARAPYFVSEALIDAVFPLMARRESRVVSHGWFIAALRWVPLAIVPLQVCLLLAPGPILRLFFPQSYGESIRLLQLLDVGTLGLLLTNMLVKGMCALGQAPRVARRMPIAVAVELTGLALLVPSFGGQGAATAYCLGAWAGVLLLGPVYLQEQQVSLLPRAI